MALTAETKAPAPERRKRVAVFGGSFNPPHIAHVLAVAYVLSVAPIDAVLVVPVYLHPFSKELAPFEHRLAMCRLGLGWLPGVDVSPVERDLGGESLTLRTLEHLAAEHPDWDMRLLVGADVLSDLPKWHRFDRIQELAPPIVLGRAGFPAEHAARHGASSAPPPAHHGEHPAVPAPALRASDNFLPQVSSTEIREALVAGDVESVRSRVPRVVLDYVVQHRLYRSAA